MRAQGALGAAARVLAGCAGAPPASTPSAQQAARPAAAADAAVPEAVARLHAEALGLLEAGSFDAAEPLLLEMVAAAPRLAGPRINLALLYLHTGRLEQAQAALEAALAQQPQNAAARTELGVVLRMRGRFAQAEAAYLAALAADPGCANAHYNLGVLYDLYLRRPADALAHYERYQALAGGDALVAKWIADLSRRQGETRTAEVLER
jgi:tetratricopeptide (TPR) repeat protein